MQIYEALDIKKYPCIISVIGGGGKTSTMFSLAGELSRQGKKVLVTTTTHISVAQGQELNELVVELVYEEAVKKLRESFENNAIVGLTTTEVKEKKLKGIPGSWIGSLKREKIADVIIVEADGARGRSFKAPNAYEPVLPDESDSIILVLGMDIVGKPITDEYVHRPDRVLALLEKDPKEKMAGLTQKNIVKTIFHREGLLRKVDKNSEIIIMINKVDIKQQGEAIELGEKILLESTFQNIKVLIGQVQKQKDPINCKMVGQDV